MGEIYKCFSKEVFVIHGSDPHMRNLNPVRSWPNKRNSAKLLENMKSKPSWQILLPHARANINQHYLSEATQDIFASLHIDEAWWVKKFGFG